MSLRAQIQDQIKQAMKDKDSLRLDSLRYLWSEIKNAEIDAKVELTDESIQEVIAREVKKRREAINQMVEAGRESMVTDEQSKLDVFMEFMPEQLSDQDLEQVIDQVVSEVDQSDFGRVMGQVMSKVKGKADGSKVQQLVKQKLG